MFVMEALDGCIVHKVMLLTGAGASWAFGGILAPGVRERIFTRKQVQDRQRVRDMLLAFPSFEYVLGEVRRDSKFDEEDRLAIESAIKEVFLEMDKDIAKQNYWNGGECNVNSYREFLHRFGAPAANGSKTASFVFTLNQDLTLERHWFGHAHTAKPQIHPGIPAPIDYRWFTSNIGAFTEDMISSVPSNPVLELARNTNVIKLHGSINWRASDGSDALIMGTGKPEQIDRFPILKAYQELFKMALKTPGARLLVHGYSFTDEHINTAISEAVETSDLEVYLWDTSVFDLLYTISRKADCLGIAERVRGTWSSYLHEMFPASGAEPAQAREIRQKFFLADG